MTDDRKRYQHAACHSGVKRVDLKLNANKAETKGIMPVANYGAVAYA